MKFLGKKEEQLNPVFPIEDYIDPDVISSLLPKHRHFIDKLIKQPSSATEKLFSKIASNQIYLNSDMLSRMLDHLFLQGHLPLEILNPHYENAWEDYLSGYYYDTKEPKQRVWNQLLNELGIWANKQISTNIIHKMMNICHQLLEEDECPNFSQTMVSPPKNSRFWQKQSNISEKTMMDNLFKYVYEKIKYFHSELIPNAKRPIDLYELYCLIEDAALEHHLIVYSESHLEFLRALNASVLIYSTIFSFPMAIPDLISEQLDLSEPLNESFFLNFFNRPDFVPIFGQHQYLKNYNYHAFIEGMSHVIKLRHRRPHSEDVLSDFLDNDEVALTARFIENHTGRLIFTFNRLTSLGYLLRSPLLKGLGYHPLINTEAPTKLKQNFEIFVQLLKTESYDRQLEIIQHILPSNVPISQYSLDPEI